MSNAITIYGDSFSGNCLKVKFICDKLTLPYRWIETSVLKKETRTPAFLVLNPAGQVPVIVLPDGVPLAQSNAIMLYLADGSDLVPREPVACALVMQWLFWEQYSHEPALAVLSFQKSHLKKADHEINPELRPKSESALSVMEQHLSSRQYFVIDRLTLADIALVAYTRKAHEAGLDLARWPAVRAWVARIETDLGLAAYGRL
jgi:glutathione S-transferase